MPPVRLNLFDVLRLLAATLVIYGHSFPLLGLGEPGADLPSRVWPFTDAGAIGVYIFFTISGYLNAKSVVKNRPAVFYLNRCLRIFPGLLVALLFTVLVIGIVCTRLPAGTYLSSAQTWFYVLDTGLLLPGHSSLPGVFEDNLYKGAVNGSLWTLRIEFVLYLMLPIVVNLPGKKWMSALLLAASFLVAHLVLVHMSVKAAHFPQIGFVDAVAANAFCFFAGAFMAYAQWDKTSPLRLVGVLTVLLVSAHTVYGLVCFFLLFPLLVIQVGSIETRARVLTHDFSYGLYIYAFPVQQATYHFLAGSWPATWLAALALALAMLLAALSWFWVEKPMLAKRDAIAASLLRSPVRV